MLGACKCEQLQAYEHSAGPAGGLPGKLRATREKFLAFWWKYLRPRLRCRWFIPRRARLSIVRQEHVMATVVLQQMATGA